LSPHCNQVPQYNKLCANNQGNRGGFRGVGHGRGRFGKGRGPITYHNFYQLVHYARDFPQPPATCMYCPILLKKIQDKKNYNNRNVQWIALEIIDDWKKTNVVTRGGSKTRVDAVNHNQNKH
jgi:hypothetical protein